MIPTTYPDPKIGVSIILEIWGVKTSLNTLCYEKAKKDDIVFFTFRLRCTFEQKVFPAVLKRSNFIGHWKALFPKKDPHLQFCD